MAVLEEFGIELGPEDVTPDLRAVAAAGVAGLATDLAVRSGVAVLGGSLLVAVVAAGMAASGRLRTAQAQVLVGASVVFGAFLSLRAAPWLVALDIAVCGGLLLTAASFARGGSVFDVRAADLAMRAVHTVGHTVAAPGFLARAFEGRRLGAGPNAAAAVRGVLVAVPLVLVLGVLLASADAVFASFFRVSLDGGSLIAHLVLIAVGMWGAAALLRLASTTPPEPVDGGGPRLGTVETGVVLAAMVALYAAFAFAQVVAASEGGRRVLETAGLTYAEYARSGFFQLLAVAALTLVALTVLRRAIADGPPALTVLAGAAVLLTLVVVGVALRRLHLYEQAFGLTVQRLLAVLFAAWVGAVFVLLAASLAGVGRDRSWLAGASAAVGVALLLVVNVLDAEALVVRRNLAHAERTGRFDIDYLAGLSEDAVPVLVDGLDRVPTDARQATVAALCDPYRVAPGGEGWAGWNRSVRRAEAARSRIC